MLQVAHSFQAMAEKKCSKCGAAFKGYGEQCSSCRKAGLNSKGSARACDTCGAFFTGLSSTCEDCPESSQTQIKKKQWDGDGVPLEESNVSGIGSDEDKELRKKAAGTEPAWEGIGLEPGLWIFRIESFKVVPWPKEKYGQFHSGDSYICLFAEFGIEEETGAPSEKLDLDIHFWLGKTTTTDEKGTAAYKTVELDDFFDGDAVQHREVEKNESEDFLLLFPNGVTYLEGGVESGFQVTQVDLFQKKLYQCRRTKEKSIIFEEEAVALSTLNHRDCFILDCGRKIYTWFGDNASPFVKNACNLKAERMESERNGESTVITEVDDDFWEALGGKGAITAADKVGAEVAADFGEGILYAINVDAERKLDIKEVGRGELERSMLDTTGVMMLDNQKEIYLWLGKQCSEIEKRSAWSTASNYLKMNNRDPDKTAITILKEGKGRNNKVWKATFPPPK